VWLRRFLVLQKQLDVGLGSERASCCTGWLKSVTPSASRLLSMRTIDVRHCCTVRTVAYSCKHEWECPWQVFIAHQTSLSPLHVTFSLFFPDGTAETATLLDLHYRIKRSHRSRMSLTLYSPEGIIVPHQIIWSWYTGRWRVECYIWYSEDWAGPQPAQTPPRCTKCNSPPLVLRYLDGVSSYGRGSLLLPPINGQRTNHRIAV